MDQTQKMDILVGIKAELSLRDAVRVALDESDGDLELIPVGKKDWIAGVRIENSIKQGLLEEKCKTIHQKLIELKSEQRIRFENIKLYVVSKPVPVFKDPESDESDNIIASDAVMYKQHEIEAEVKKPVKNGSTICPVCKRDVHSYNLQYDSSGKVTGCFMCGGVPDIY